MARKLTEGERNTINYLTASFVAALPAHLRSHAGSIASSLVRIPREVITARDINRIVGRLGEDATQKEELRGAIRDVALVSVDVAEDAPESFALRRPEDEPAAEGAAAETEPEGANPEPAEVDTAETGDPAKKGDQPAEEPKPAKRRRRRRVGDRGGRLAEQKAAAEQQSPRRMSPPIPLLPPSPRRMPLTSPRPMPSPPPTSMSRLPPRRSAAAPAAPARSPRMPRPSPPPGSSR